MRTDLAPVRIEKSIPLPKTARTTGALLALRKMVVGDSFLLPLGLHPTSPHSYAKALGIKVTVKKHKERYRVWRIK